MQLSLPRQVHAAVRAKLLDGSLTPGMRLDYKQLALEFRVSTTPVREAVSQLASEGVVDLIPRLGAIVRSLNPDSAREYYEVREAVESFAAMKAAERLSTRHLESLRLHTDTMQNLFDATAENDGNGLKSDDLLIFLEADAGFHKTILLAARNAALARTVEESHFQSRIFDANGGTHDMNRVSLACIQHHQIFNALEKGDGRSAAEAMRNHIRTSLEFTLECLELVSENAS